jgi:arginase family enzyme
MENGEEITVRGMYGPDVTFLGVPRVELDALNGLDVVFVGAPYDSGASHRPGARFGPQATTAPGRTSRSASIRWPNCASPTSATC